MKTEKLNTYKVTSLHDVYIDSFKDGEGKHVNHYELASEIKAKDWKDAIKKYFSDYLFFGISLEHGYIDEESNTFHYSNLVNADNIEADEDEVKQWKQNKLTLYANNTATTVEQIIKIDLI